MGLDLGELCKYNERKMVLIWKSHLLVLLMDPCT